MFSYSFVDVIIFFLPDVSEFFNVSSSTFCNLYFCIHHLYFFTIVLNLLYFPFSPFASSAVVKSCKILCSSSKGSQWIAWFRRSSWSQRRSGYETKLRKNYQLKRNRHTNKANLLKDFPCPGIKLKLQ